MVYGSSAALFTVPLVRVAGRSTTPCGPSTTTFGKRAFPRARSTSDHRSAEHRAPSCSGDGCEQRKSSELRIVLLCVGEEADNILVGGGLDLGFYDLPRVRVGCGVPGDPPPFHRLLECGTNDDVDAADRGRLEWSAVPAGPLGAAGLGGAAATSFCEPGVEDVQVVRAQAGHLEGPKCPKVPVDHAPMLFHGARRPPTCLEGHPLVEQIAKGPGGAGQLALVEPRYEGREKLVRFASSRCRDRSRGVALATGERIPADECAQLPTPGSPLTRMSSHGANGTPKQPWSSGWSSER